MAMSDEEWAKAIEAEKAKDESVLTIVVPETEWDDECRVLVRRPPPGEWKRVRAMMADDNQRATSLEQLARACVLVTSRGPFGDVLKKWPAMAETIGGMLCEIAGAVKGASVKK